MDIQIAKDISNVAKEARHKATYLRRLPDIGMRNYEQEQTASEALETVAKDLEQLVAKYFIHLNLFNDTQTLELISRQCKTAIRRELARKNA